MQGSIASSDMKGCKYNCSQSQQLLPHDNKFAALGIICPAVISIPMFHIRTCWSENESKPVGDSPLGLGTTVLDFQMKVEIKHNVLADNSPQTGDFAMVKSKVSQ